MALMSWVDLRERSPIDISRLVSHANAFNSLAGVRINTQNLNRAKKSLIDARAELDLVFTTLQQVLYDREILKNQVDQILYGWLIDNIGRYQKDLDDKEENLLIKFEASDVKLVGVARVSAYAKSLKIAQQLIYESLLKSIEEYSKLEETDEIKKEPRTFLYILFHVLQITMASAGGMTRKGTTGGVMKKGQVGSFPTTWQSLVSNNGQKKIADKHNSENPTEKIEVPEFMVESGTPEDDVEDIEGEETDENTLFLEEIEEDENEDS